jgi:hypothetical protein
MQGVFLKVNTDVVLSDDEGDAESAYLPGQNALADRDASTDNDVGGVGMTSDEATVPSPAGAGVPSTTRPQVVDRIMTVPASGARGQKCLHLAVKRSYPRHQVD